MIIIIICDQIRAKFEKQDDIDQHYTVNFYCCVPDVVVLCCDIFCGEWLFEKLKKEMYLFINNI